MTNYNIIKLIKKGKKIENPQNLEDSLIKLISLVEQPSFERELFFISLYYGLIGDAHTLDSIGSLQEPALTRERIRQIIDSCVIKLKKEKTDFENPYIISQKLFSDILGHEKFLRLDQIMQNTYFQSFKKNIKGLISFFNDCDIRQIAYRKKYYFYKKSESRKLIIQQIQKENKVLRRNKTIEKISLKSKTVTYVPNEIRSYLLDFSKNKNINLNPLYELILKDFMIHKPYIKNNFTFSKTKSWKARQGKAEWQQIGIYIDKNIFDEIQIHIEDMKKYYNKNVSLMSFICQSFIWYYEKNKNYLSSHL